MRISTIAMQRLAINAILEQQRSLSQTQLQVSTGKRIINPSDDPLGSQRVLELDATLDRLGQFRTNAELARVRLSLEDNALSNATQIVQRARELVIQGSNDTQSPESRALIAAEVRQLADALLDIANSQNGQGEYLFSGFRSRTQAFSREGGVVTYNGDQGQRLLKISESRSIADGDHGATVFMQIPTGNGTFAVSADAANTGSGLLVPGAVVDPGAWTAEAYVVRFTAPDAYEVVDSGGAVVVSGAYAPGQTIAFGGIEVRMEGAPATGDSFNVTPSVNQDLFATLDALAAVLASSGQGPAERAQVRSELNASLANLDQALGTLLTVRTEVGTRLSTLDTQAQANDEYELQLETTRADIRDLDFAEAVGRLNLQLAGLEAAQQTYARLQGLSLFNFL
ncbi:MAG: flagellar hook-associated protein FlgL [Pseudomonadales bacterium]